MELWYTEKEYTYGNVAFTLRIKEHIRHESTPFQTLDVFDTHHYGKMLSLDGHLQLTEQDEFFYHEMIAHPALCALPNPERVLIIGGGDGGTAREVLKHESVNVCDMVEIDGRVVQVSRDYFPTVASALDDPRLNLHIADGIKFVADAPPATYDVILIDSSDPIGPGVGLFTVDFYRNCARIMKPQSLMVCQTGSLWWQPEESANAVARLNAAFEHATAYWSLTPTYPCGHMAYSVGANGVNPHDFSNIRDLPTETTRYYNKAVHQGAYALPTFMQDNLKRGVVG